MPRIAGEKTRQAIVVTGEGPDPLLPPEHLELYTPDGDPIDISGGGGGGGGDPSGVPFYYNNTQTVANDGEPVQYFTSTEDPPVLYPIEFPDVVVGTYMCKMQVIWDPDTYPVTSGELSVILNVDISPSENYVAYELYMTPEELAAGTKTLMDFAVAPDPGTFRLMVWQNTDQALLPIDTHLWLVHL